MAPFRSAELRSRTEDELRGRGEIYVLLFGLAAWYFGAVDGAFAVDEVIYAETGYALWQGNPYSNPTHMFAPTVKYFVGLGQVVFGQTAFGARFPIVVFSLCCVALTYLLGRELQGRITGFLSALVLGTTYFFASYSTRVMLDVPLAAFFTALVLLTLRWTRDGGRGRLVLIGAMTAAILTTKAYGVFYVAAPLGVIAATLWRRYDGRRALRESRYPLAGGVLVLAVIYLPFVFVSHPPVPARYGTLIQALLQVPVLGNFVYVFGAAVLRNVVHASGGHAIEIAGTVYQYPPIWSYLYWLYELGGFVLLGLFSLAAIGSVYEGVRQRARDRMSLRLGSFVLVPFVCLSLLTVKFPRYMIPLFPLVSATGIYSLYRLLGRAAQYGSKHERLAASDSVVPVLLGAVVLSAALLPPSPLVRSVTTPLDNDTGYDRIAESIGEHADETAGNVTVLTYSGSIRTGLEYYLRGRDSVRIESFRLKNAINETQCKRYRRRIVDGRIDLVVAQGNIPRLTRFCRDFPGFVRSRGDQVVSVTQPDSETLTLYGFENETVAR